MYIHVTIYLVERVTLAPLAMLATTAVTGLSPLIITIDTPQVQK